MVNPKNPFVDFDFQKLMADFRMPGMDIEAVAVAQKKNLEALTAANQLAVEGFQAVAKRQMEIIQQALQDTQRSMQDMAGQSSPEDKVAQQADLMKSTLEKTVSNMRELSEMLAKSNQEAFEVINKRVTESLEEIKQLSKKR